MPFLADIRRFVHHFVQSSSTFCAMKGLDSTDRRMIALLRADGRAPVSALATALHISRGTAQTRLNRLVAEGVIRGFTIQVGAGADEGLVRAVTTIQLTGASARTVVRRLRVISAIRAVHTTNGKWDLVAEIAASSLEDLDEALTDMRAIEGISLTETSLLLRTL